MGSAAYAPAIAADTDYTWIIPNRGIKIPERREMQDFIGQHCPSAPKRFDFKTKYGELYAFQDFPGDDAWLAGFFMTGHFYPDASPAEDCYEALHGRDYMPILWEVVADQVIKNFPNWELRDFKRSKDFLFLLRATETLGQVEENVTGVAELFSERYKELCNTRQNLPTMEFDREARILTEMLAQEVRAL